MKKIVVLVAGSIMIGQTTLLFGATTKPSWVPAAAVLGCLQTSKPGSTKNLETIYLYNVSGQLTIYEADTNAHITLAYQQVPHVDGEYNVTGMSGKLSNSQADFSNIVQFIAGTSAVPPWYFSTKTGSMTEDPSFEIKLGKTCANTTHVSANWQFN